MSFQLLVITPEKQVPGEIDLLTTMFVHGLQTLHVRKPGFTKVQLSDYLEQLPARYRGRVVIHAHYSLLRDFPLKGIHLTEKTRSGKLPSAFVSAKHTLSASFHVIDEVKRARRTYDYVFLSPVFDSISKKGYRSKFLEDELLLLLKDHTNVIALGGVSVQTLDIVKRLKFKGAAVLGFIWESEDPVKSYRLLASKIK